jgi:hypothetical protein
MTFDDREHLTAIHKFAESEKQEVLRKQLETSKGRRLFLKMLDHDFVTNPDAIVAIGRVPTEREATLHQLRRLGASETCYTLSDNPKYNDKTISLKEVCNLIASDASVLVSSVPGRLGCYSSKSRNVRFIIDNSKIAKS